MKRRTYVVGRTNVAFRNVGSDHCGGYAISFLWWQVFPLWGGARWRWSFVRNAWVTNRKRVTLHLDRPRWPIFLLDEYDDVEKEHDRWPRGWRSHRRLYLPRSWHLARGASTAQLARETIPKGPPSFVWWYSGVIVNYIVVIDIWWYTCPGDIYIRVELTTLVMPA